ncbi:PKHG6 protein, partial [Amia calva]|nr:PKHG6 protein [Amia calva]
MRVGDMQARPHQRITKYPLLLQAVRSWTEHTGTAQALTDMLVSVNSFLAAVNTYLQTRADQSSLRETAQRIEGYQLLEGGGEELDRQLRKFCQIDLTSPIVGAGPNDIRKLLLEETLKIRDKKDSKVELSVLLFSDVLLLCRSHRKSDRLRVTRPPLHLHRVHCRPLRDPCNHTLTLLL